MLETFQLATLKKFFDRKSAAGDEPGKDQAEEYQPLAPNEEVVPLEGGEEMGRTFDEQFEKPEGRDGDAIAQIVAVICLAIFVLTTWLITILSGTSWLWFAWHPLLISLGVALFSYGILTLQPTSQAKTKAAGLVRHQLAMIGLGMPAAFLGFLAIFFTKIKNNREHFTTWHGLFGIITISMLFAQVILGGGSVWFNGRLFGGNPQAKLVWKYHRLVGYMTLASMLLTAHLGGVWSNWANEHSVGFVRILAYTLAPVGLIGAVYSRIRLSKMKFF